MSQGIKDLFPESVDSTEQPSNNPSVDEDGTDEYGPDLYKDEEDHRRLRALPEVHRERILNERYEKRQLNLERRELRRLLNDGRREDGTRRSTRAKRRRSYGGLSELFRRPETKTVAAAQGTDDPDHQQTKRKKHDHHTAVTYSDARNDGMYEKRTPTLNEIQAAVLSRHEIEKWLYAPYFQNVAIGSYVRISIGENEQGIQMYRLCQAIDIVPYHTKYLISRDSEVWSNQALKVKHGKAERVFTMDLVSNQPVTMQEYSRLIRTCQVEQVSLPDMEHVKAKTQDFAAARSYVLNENNVSQMIEKKQAVVSRKINVAKEKAVLQAKLEHARITQDNQLIDETMLGLRKLKDIKQARERAVEMEQNEIKETRRRVAAKIDVAPMQWNQDSPKAKWVADQAAKRNIRREEEKTTDEPVVGFRELYRKVASEMDMVLLI